VTTKPAEMLLAGNDQTSLKAGRGMRERGGGGLHLAF
jgi:hypothetical protein